MRNHFWTIGVAGALLLPCLCAAQGTAPVYAMNGPSLGLVFDSESTMIRPILGIPGAATLGPALNPGFTVEEAFTAPGGDFVLAVSKDDRRVAAVSAGGAVHWLTPATAEAPGTIEFSPDGSAAALYYRGSARLLVTTGLRGATPQVATVDPASVPGAPALVALSDDAASLLLAIPEGGDTALYYLPVNSAASATVRTGGVRSASSTPQPRAHNPFARRLGTFQSIAALRFVGSSSDALLADSKANAVYFIQSSSGAAQISAIGTATDGLAQPAAVDALDARRILVANAGTASLTILSRDGAPAISIPCASTPARLMRLPGNAVYRLTDLSKDPVWVLDASGAEPRILAVPPDPAQDTATAAAAKGARQ